jgi:hypothetical protein
MDAAEIVKHLRLERHPEGGWFRETYRARETTPREALPERFRGPRAHATSILYLLERGDRSRLHRIAADEIWHFHLGDPLVVHVLEGAMGRRDLRLGPDLARGQQLTGVVEAGAWFGARSEGGAHGFSLVACTVAPGFDFEDFEFGDRARLLEAFPGERELILALT